MLPFSDDAAERLRDFARAVEPRLASTGDLEPIVDWASKLVGAVARLSGLLHLADLVGAQCIAPADGLAPADGIAPVSPGAVDAAVILADYLTAHARAAYDAMGLDPAVAQAPVLLTWLRRAGLTTFTRRDARHAVRSHMRSDYDLDAALDQLENHGYIRARATTTPARRGAGRPPSPAYDAHPSLAPPSP